MPATILAIIFFIIGLGVGVLIEHLRFTMGSLLRLEGEKERLKRRLALREREIAKLDRDNKNLNYTVQGDQSRQILQSVGWMPLKGACLPADGDRIQVAGVDTDTLQQAPPGYHYARFKKTSESHGRLSNSGTGVTVNLNGSVLWKPQ